MKLLVPLVGIFIVIGCTQTRITRKTSIMMVAVILIVALYYLLTTAS